MTIVVTGAAGFIGFHVAGVLCKRGEQVIGIDNFNDYYDVSLKKSRLERLKKYKNFNLRKVNIADFTTLEKELEKEKKKIKSVIHLAAQAGVRYSLDHPFKYTESNITGHLSILELCRKLPNLEHLVYASSSSVYGGNTQLPYSVEQRTDSPISLYAATKKSCELISHSYNHLYGIPLTGLRFFTVYGPWGRPDMAYFLFTKAILEGKPIKVFAEGKLKRDFTYIDDVVPAILSALGKIPKKHSVYNIGNDRSESVNDMIAILEEAIGRKAKTEQLPMQPGDMVETHADINKSRRDLGYDPKTTIKEGLPAFVGWYKEYYKE